MRRVFIVLVYKKRVLCRYSNGPTAQSMCTQAVSPMLGQHKTTAYVVISELDDYEQCPLTQLPKNCHLRDVHGCSSAMSLMLVGNVTCCFASKVN